jgi:hypothetical protein
MEINTEVPQRLKDRPTFCLTKSIMGLYLKEDKSLQKTKTCILMLIEVLFTTPNCEIS